MNQIIPGRISNSSNSIHIWGAGFSGLIIGYYLKKNGFQVTLYEKSNRVGGKIKTKKTPYGLAETGANAIYLNEDCRDLISELNLTPYPVSNKLKKLILINGKPRRAIQFSLLTKGLLNVYKKPPLISEGLTVADFFRPLLGDEVIENVLSPALGGIYATPSDKLHFKSVFESTQDKAQFSSYWEFLKQIIFNKKQKTKNEIKGSISFEGGMQVLINKLHDELKDNIRLNYNKAFSLKENTIICTDAANASVLLKDFRPNLSTELSRIKYQSLSSVTVFLKREIKSLHRAFGIVIPLGTNFHSIGIVNNKASFPINNQNVFAYTLISKKKLSEKEIFGDLKSLHFDFVPEDLEHVENSFWDQAIPIYDLQRYLSIKKIHELMRDEDGLAIFGNYVSGISLRQMVSLAKNFAEASSIQKKIHKDISDSN